MKTKEEMGRLQTGRCPVSPAHSPRGNVSPLPDPGADPGRRPPRHPPAATALSPSRNCGEAPTSMEHNWGEAQMETGDFCVILNFLEPRDIPPGCA